MLLISQVELNEMMKEAEMGNKTNETANSRKLAVHVHEIETEWSPSNHTAYKERGRVSMPDSVDAMGLLRALQAAGMLQLKDIAMYEVREIKGSHFTREVWAGGRPALGLLIVEERHK